MRSTSHWCYGSTGVLAAAALPGKPTLASNIKFHNLIDALEFYKVNCYPICDQSLYSPVTGVIFMQRIHVGAGPLLSCFQRQATEQPLLLDAGVPPCISVHS